jgi:hypothetical protein
MSTTVTTTTINSASLLNLGAVIALVVVILLIASLITKEIMSSVLDSRALSVNRVLSVAAIPLGLVFASILISKLIPVFG